MNGRHEPAYISLFQSGTLGDRAAKAFASLSSCSICPRQCQVNRLQNKRGFCRAGLKPVVSSYNSHFGEEPPISGVTGSGAIFFTHCHLRCVYCQNYPISQIGNGAEITIAELARIMLFLQEKKCHNINLVSGTIYVPHILSALEKAAARGLRLPIVYNTSGYESIETLQLLDGVVDIYLPDAKYSDDSQARAYSRADNYWEINKSALREMHRQVGELICDQQGIAQHGLIIRHLVLPHHIGGSMAILEFIAQELSPKTFISIMSQYQPRHLAHQFSGLKRTLKKEEYEPVLQKLPELQLENGWIQEM